MTKTHLFLFDIDGTLIASGGAGEHALRIAIKEQFDSDDGLSSIEIAGRTDKFITQVLFEKLNVEATPERLTAFLDCYLFHLARQLPLKDGRLLPGIIELLDILKAREYIALGLLTGNLERGAQLKLEHYDVWRYFEFGAYADDHHDRNQLGPVAQSRALKRYGVDIAPERTFVLGDTPYDIECGVAIGAKTVGIATGSYSREQLAAHNPDFLYDDLSDVACIVADLGI